MTGQRILGHGIDLVDLGRFRHLIENAAPGVLVRYFTPSELNDAGDGAVRFERLAGRFAIKEAVLKALGLGWGDGIAFTDVETTTASSGAPGITLHRKVARDAEERGITNWLISTAHTGSATVASVIATGP